MCSLNPSLWSVRSPFFFFFVKEAMWIFFFFHSEPDCLQLPKLPVNTIFSRRLDVHICLVNLKLPKISVTRNLLGLNLNSFLIFKTTFRPFYSYENRQKVRWKVPIYHFFKGIFEFFDISVRNDWNFITARELQKPWGESTLLRQ